MAALDQSQGTFTLTHARGATQEHADALDVDQGRMQISPRGKLLLQKDRGLRREVLGLQLSSDERHAMLIGKFQQDVIRRQTA